MWLGRTACLCFLIGCYAHVMGQQPCFPVHSKRILFLGDSITHAGNYISLLESQLRLRGHAPDPVLFNLGLPS